jgi:hypothetical protein
MKLKPGELSGEKYQLLEQLNHQELIPFIKTNINKQTFYSRFYILLNAVFFILTGYLFGLGLASESMSILDCVIYLVYGVAFTFLLIPFHEGLHALAYKALGAPHTSFDYNLKKLYFVAIADQFVVNKKEFIIVALTPFVVISALFLGALFFLPLHWQIACSTTLIVHTSMCVGDFALLSYFASNKNKRIVTYDDKENGLSYFIEIL